MDLRVILIFLLSLLERLRDYARPRILTRVALTDRSLFQFGVLSRRRFSFHFFPHSTRAFAKPALFQRCSLSRFFDERVRNRALDRSAPLNALEPSRVREEKNCFKGKYKCRTQAKKE